MPRPVSRSERETMTTRMSTILRSPTSSRSNMENLSFMNNPPKSPRRNIADYEPPRRSAMRWRGARDLTGFSTPQRVTVMGREREMVEFRTPQHPIAGTNNWGGASPLLSRNIPEESRGTSYLRFDAVSALDHDDEDKTRFPARAATSRSRMGRATPARRERKGGSESRRGGILSMLRWWGRRREEEVLRREKKKSSWRPVGDHRNRWPQGW